VFVEQSLLESPRQTPPNKRAFRELRFEVQYPKGEPHEIELQGTVAILGRDPSCDLVLNDSKCSRRHAVLEAGPQGIAIRDTGSANGVYVNGKKVERAQLAEGDVVRLGEVRLTVLPEDVPGTLVMGPEDMDDLQTPSGRDAALQQAAAAASRRSRASHASTTADAPAPPPPPPPRPAARPAEARSADARTASLPPSSAAVPARSASVPPKPVAPASRPPAREVSRPPVKAAASSIRPRTNETPGRPLTVTVLAVLWGLSALLYLVAGIGLAFARKLSGTTFAFSISFGVLLALFSVLMAVGLLGLRGWARILQIASAAIGILSCVYTLSSITVLVYMLRPAAALHFSGRPLRTLSAEEAETVGDRSAETAFTIAILGTLFLGAAFVAVGLFVAGRVGRSL
jgi:Inner membrane component of T3SS, cytoplasmic domain